jgi:AraC family transcriptional regulator
MLLRSVPTSQFQSNIAVVMPRHLGPSVPVNTAGLENSGIPVRRGVLVLNVQLSPSEVRQSWQFEDREMRRGAVEPTLEIVGIGLSLLNPTRSGTGVIYQIPQASLDAYTDAQNLHRLSVDHGSRTYNCEVLSRLTHLILPSLAAPHLSSPAFLHHFGMMFCSHVVHIHTAGVPEPSTSRGGLSAWQKRVATDFLASKGYENTKLSILAEECHLSVSHFARSFKTSFGQPVHRWLVNQRVEKSKELLLKTDSPLVEVAFQAGFTDQATFNRTFAKLVGTSPGRWRKAYRTPSDSKFLRSA